MLKIGTHILRNNVFLAPMAGITDKPFRELCAREGAGFAASEMISSNTLVYASAKTRHRVSRSSASLPHAVQIAGADPQEMAAAAELNVANGAEIIDINMGCPAKKVCNKAAGSALLQHPDLVKRILRAVVKCVDVPVTLKIRTGPDRYNRNGVAIARIAEQEGISLLAVHGRTKADRFKGSAEYATITDIKKAVAIPVIANGDIRTAEDALSVLAQTGADGVMIGRAAQGNPWVFREVTAAIAGQAQPEAPDAAEVCQTLLTHLHGLYELYGEFRGVRIARKHIAWYCKGYRNASEFRAAAYELETADAQQAIITQFFAEPERFNAIAA